MPDDRKVPLEHMNRFMVYANLGRTDLMDQILAGRVPLDDPQEPLVQKMLAEANRAWNEGNARGGGLDSLLSGSRRKDA